MNNWQEGDVLVDHMRLHYYRSGTARPPLVFVHGFTDNALYWTRTARTLEADWEVVMYDARGHGLSQRAGGHFSDSDRVDDLLGVIQALGLVKPVLVGHSMGAATIALAAARYPDMGRAIILEDPAWYEPPPGESAEDAAKRLEKARGEVEEWRAWIQGLQASSRETGLAQIRTNSPKWSEIDQLLSFNSRLQVETSLFDHFPPEQSPWRSLLPKISCPILLLLGDNPQRSAIITVEQAAEAARLWQRGRWVQIAGAGHSIRYDQFESYLQVVQTFLGELEQI
jgi:N-formylmaleamate deformylase